MTTYQCPECGENLYEEEAGSPYTDISEMVWVCYNKKCSNYDAIVFDGGDISDFEEENAMERAMEEEAIARHEREMNK